VMIPAGATRAFTAVRRDLHVFDLKTGRRLP
jgi:hypothetical protein